MILAHITTSDAVALYVVIMIVAVLMAGFFWWEYGRDRRK